MSIEIIVDAKIDNVIEKVTTFQYTPKEIKEILLRLPSITFSKDAPSTEQTSYMHAIVKQSIPELSNNSIVNNFESLYYAIIENNPALDYKTHDIWQGKDFDITVETKELQPQITLAPKKFTEKNNLEKRLQTTNLSELSDNLNSDVIGQEKAISSILDNLYLLKAGALGAEDGLVCHYLMGPSGVGKTSFVRSMSNNLQLPLERFDCSEYQNTYDAKRFLGATPGLVGYDEKGGPLPRFVTENPNGIILFDEAEKMHPSVWQALTNFLDTGVIKDGDGRDHQFNGLVYFTSNIGNSFGNSNGVGFSTQTSDERKYEKQKELIKKQMAPELRGRIYNFTPFIELTQRALGQIVDSIVAKKNEHFTFGNIELSDIAKSELIKRGASIETGVRNMQNTYLQDIILPFIKQNESVNADKKISVDYVDDTFIYNC